MTQSAFPPETLSKLSEGRSLVALGRILEAHGIAGEVKIQSFTACPEDVAAYGPLSTADGKRYFEIEAMRATKGAVVIAKIMGVRDRDEASALKGLELYVARDLLPEAGEEEFYHTDLIGLEARPPHGEAFGTVTAVHNFGAGDLIEVRFKNSRRTELFMFNKETVPTIDFAGGFVVIAAPFEKTEG